MVSRVELIVAFQPVTYAPLGQRTLEYCGCIVNGLLKFSFFIMNLYEILSYYCIAAISESASPDVIEKTVTRVMSHGWNGRYAPRIMQRLRDYAAGLRFLVSVPDHPR